MSKKKTRTTTKASDPTKAVNKTLEPVVKTKSTEEKYNELKDLSQALIREVDNVYTSPLKPDHQSQLLGTVIKSFADRVNKL